MDQTARFQETLRRLAMIDEGFAEIRAGAGLDPATTPAPDAGLRSSICRRRDLVAILSDSVALLQTPVVAEPTEAGLS